jgi:transposase-like protein
MDSYPLFSDEATAREALEALRWPKGVVCIHCAPPHHNVARIGGTKQRKGIYGCRECRAQFTVTIGTMFERSRVPLHKWMQALLMFTATNKQSVLSISHSIGVTYKTARGMAAAFDDAIGKYPGPNQGLGARAQELLRKSRPSEHNPAASMRAQRKRQRMRARGIPLISQQRIRTTGALKPYVQNSDAREIKRLELVLRALLAS